MLWQQSCLKNAVRQSKCERKWPWGLKTNWLLLVWSSGQMFTTVENLLPCRVPWLLSTRPRKVSFVLSHFPCTAFRIKQWFCWSMTPTGPRTCLYFPSLRPVTGIRTLKLVLAMAVSHRTALRKAGSKVGFAQFCLILLSSFTTSWGNWNKTWLF